MFECTISHTLLKQEPRCEQRIWAFPNSVAEGRRRLLMALNCFGVVNVEDISLVTGFITTNARFLDLLANVADVIQRLRLSHAIVISKSRGLISDGTKCDAGHGRWVHRERYHPMLFLSWNDILGRHVWHVD